MLREQTLFGERDMVATAIERLRTFEPPEGYYLAFSGGKDSIVIHDIARRSGVKFDAHYNLTGIDHPELVRFIFSQYSSVAVHRPQKTMWQLIVERGIPPTRLARYCCEELKERGGTGRCIATGIRAQESVQRSQRRMVEICRKDKSKRFIHPIIDWPKLDVWDYIHGNNLSYPSLYDQGYHRLGCIGCPMASDQVEVLMKYPRYYALYLRAFGRMLERRKQLGKKTEWKTAEDVMHWWLVESHRKKDYDQTPCLFGFGEMEEEEP